VLYTHWLFLCYAALRNKKKRTMQCEDSMESRMLMDVMKELREEGRPISIGRLFAITVNTTKVYVFFLLPWPLNKFLRFI